MNRLELTEHRILVALFIDSHRPERRYMTRDNVHTDYHTDVEMRLFNSIVTDLRKRSIAKATPQGGTYAVRLHSDGYKEALATILRSLDADTFDVDWQTKRIITDTEGDDLSALIPCPNGWMVMQADRLGKLASAPIVREDDHNVVAPTVFSTSASNRIEGPWTKWGVIIAVVGVLVTILIAMWT